MITVAELLSTNVETESEFVDHDTDKSSSAWPFWQDASIYVQVSKPKLNSVSVTVHVKGNEKGNVGGYVYDALSFYYWLYMLHAICSHWNWKVPWVSHCKYTMQPSSCSSITKAGTKCIQSSLEDSFLTEETDTGTEASFMHSQQDCTTK